MTVSSIQVAPALAMYNASAATTKRRSRDYRVTLLSYDWMTISDAIVMLFRPAAVSGIVMKSLLNENRTAINNDGLPSSKSFLHQEQIGLCDFVRFTHSANRETIAHTFVKVLSFFFSHVLPEVRPNDSGRYRVYPSWRQLYR